MPLTDLQELAFQEAQETQMQREDREEHLSRFGGEPGVREHQPPALGELVEREP